MRILRSQPDNEVSSTGFALFTAGLIIAGFFGGAMRTLFSSDQIQSRILSELQAALPNLQVKMDSARVSLARGIWPGLSISIPHLHLSKPEACAETSGNLDVENIELPLDIIPLFSSRVHWDVVSAERLTLAFGHKPCPTKKNVAIKFISPPETDAAKETKELIEVRDRIAKGFVGVYKLREHVGGIRIKTVKISSLDDPSWQIDIQKLDFLFQTTLTAAAQVHFQKRLPGGEIEHSASFEATGDAEKLAWALRSPLKEGLITWTGNANHVTDSLVQRVTIRQLPLKDILQEFQTVMDLAKGGSPRFIWLSCDLNQNGPLSAFNRLPLVISECKIDGEGEQIVVLPGQELFAWERVPLHQPLRISINRLSLQTLFDLFGQKGLPAILPKPGQWTGEIQFSGPKKWQMMGDLENAEIIFSNQNVRGKQVIAKMHTMVRSENDQVSGTLSRVVLADGSSEGTATFHFDPKFRNGEYQVEMNALSLSPSVQTLMTGGVSTPMKVTGRGSIENGEVYAWKGSAEWRHTAGLGWRAVEPRLETEYQDGSFMLRLHLQSADLGTDFPYAATIERMLGDTQGWKFRDGFLQARISSDGGEIKEARARGPSGRGVRFQGRWARGGELSGVAESGGKRWKLLGRDGHVSADEVSE